MRVLVACEESQVVCKAFRAKGHEAYSCDIISCSGGHPEWHIQTDILNLRGMSKPNDPVSTPKVPSNLPSKFDLMIAHPPCTYLANSGVCHLYNKDKSRNEQRWEELEKASDFFYSLWNAPIPKICIENPIPHKYARLPKYTQIIHPWQFGHMEQKPTCLWLKGLPKLTETNNVKEEMLKLPANKRQRIHYMPPSESRQKERSVTYQGVADAFAEQWG
jgi:hypothetical protein